MAGKGTRILLLITLAMLVTEIALVAASWITPHQAHELTYSTIAAYLFLLLGLIDVFALWKGLARIYVTLTMLLLAFAVFAVAFTGSFTVGIELAPGFLLAIATITQRPNGETRL